MKIGDIDNGNTFDFGRTSDDYAKYRDIYPDEFYNKILSRELCCDGQAEQFEILHYISIAELTLR